MSYNRVNVTTTTTTTYAPTPLSLSSHLSAGQITELTNTGVNAASLDGNTTNGELTTNVILGGTITSSNTSGITLSTSAALALLGNINTTAGALSLTTSSTDGLLVLGNLTALSNLSLSATAGPVRTTVPSTLKTTATTGGSTTVNGNTGAALYGSILAGTQATNTGPSWLAADATPASFSLTGSGDVTLAGATAVAGTTTITAPKVTITAAGGVISRGSLSITANGTATGQGLFSSGLLVAGGTVNTALTALTPTNPSGITSSSTTSVQGSTLQQANIVLDAASTATLSLTVNRDAVDALVLGGSTSGTGNAQTDLVVAGAWMAAPNVSMTAPQSPRILHDLIARDGLTITANSATAANKTIRLSPLSQILLGNADSTSTTATVDLRATSINLPGDTAGLAIEALNSAPQDFLSGNLTSALSLNLAVTRQVSGGGTGVETKTFTASVSQPSPTSLTALITAINSAINTAATAVGLVAANGEIPVLDLRGANVRLTLKVPAGSTRLNSSLGLALNSSTSTGLAQLGSFTSSTALQAVTPATFLSRAKDTTLNFGSANQKFTSLQWDGGVRSSNSDVNSSVTANLRPVNSSSTLNLNAALDVPVVNFTPDSSNGAVTNLLPNFNLLGRTKSFQITQAGNLTLTSLADVSAAPNLTSLTYRSTAGALTLSGSSNSNAIPTYATTAALSLVATGAITIGQSTNQLVLRVPTLSLSTSGAITIGSGADLITTGASGSGSFSISGGSVSIAGGLTTTNSNSTTVSATAGSLSLTSTARLTGLKGAQTFTATGTSSDLTQATSLGDSNLNAAISLSAGRHIISTAPITTAAALTLTASAGNISTAEEIYTTTNGVLVDKLGYRVNTAGAFINTGGSVLSGSERPVYEGLPTTPSSGGAIRAGSLTATASGSNRSITLAGSVFPAGTPAVTTLTATLASFSDANDQFTINGHGLSTGTAVRFYGVQEGALLPLVDGSLYYIINTGANTFKLAGTLAEANAGTALSLSVAASITSGTLAMFSPQVSLGTSSVSLSAGSISISGNIQTQTLSATTSSGDLRILEEAWLSTGSSGTTSFSTPSNALLLIDRTLTDLRRAILTTSSLSLPSSGRFELKGFLDLKPTTPGATPTFTFPGAVTITGELTSSANLSLTTSGALNVSRAGSIEAAGNLTLTAGSFNLDADATRPGWELTTVPSAVTPVTVNKSVATGSGVSQLSYAFNGDVKLIIDASSDTLSYVGVDGSLLPHGLTNGTILYLQNGAANNTEGRAGLINTNTTEPALATGYTVLVWDANRFKLQRNNSTVDLTSASGTTTDVLVGLDSVSTQVERTITQVTQIDTQQIRVGNQWNTYDLALNHDAFYRPATGEIREYFVPGVDFSVADIPWASTGITAPPTSGTLGTSWEQYSQAQREAVLKYLGYKPLYSTTISNAVNNESINGNITPRQINNPWSTTKNNILLPTSGNLDTMAIEGTTDALAKVVSNETFEGLAATATQDWTFATGAASVASGGTHFSQFLGSFANGTKGTKAGPDNTTISNGQDAWKTYSLDGNGGTISFDFYRIDSWDDELFKVYANDTEILSNAFNWTSAVPTSSIMEGSTNGYSWKITAKDNYRNHFGSSSYNDQTFAVSITVPTGFKNLKLGFGSNLDENNDNESYGIDALSVVNASAVYSTTSANTSATNALLLDGINDYADLPDMSLGGSMTIEAWVKMDQAANSWSRFVDIGNGSNQNGIVLCNEAATGKLAFYTFDPNGLNGSGVVTNEALPTGRWVHLAAVLNTDKSVKLFVDGVLKKTGNVTHLPTEATRTNTWVGRSGISGDAYLNASIRDLKIWNDARTDAEVRNDMSLNPSGSDDALMAWYPFTEASTNAGVSQSKSGVNNNYTWTVTPRANYGNNIGSTATGFNWADQSFDVNLKVPTGVTNFKLGFSSGLNESTLNEAYGIDDLTITSNAGTITDSHTFEGTTATATQGWNFAGTASVNSSSTGPASTQFLGSFANGVKSDAGQDAWKTFTLDGNGATINFRLNRIDSWDGEAFRVYANDQIVLETNFNLVKYTQPITGGGGTLPASVLNGGASVGVVAGSGSVAANGTSREWIGTYTDTAKVLYSQTASAFTAATLNQTISNPLDSDAGTSTLTATISEITDNTGSKWQVGYDSNGNRSYQVNGLRTDLSGTPQASTVAVNRVPDWVDNTTFNSNAYPSSGSTVAFGSQKGNAPLILGYTPLTNLETFDNTATGWSVASGSVPIASNTFYGSYMGPFANGTKTNNQDVWKTYTLDGTGNGAQISFTMLRLDGWEPVRNFEVYINDVKLFEHGFETSLRNFENTPPSEQVITPASLINGYLVSISPRNDWGYRNSGSSQDSAFDIIISVPAGIASLKLGFGSTLDRASTVHSYGIDNVAVINAAQNPIIVAPFSNSVQLDYIRSTASLSNRTSIPVSFVTVGTLPTTAKTYLASGGATNNTDGYNKSEGLTVTTIDQTGQSQNFRGYTRQARLTNSAEVAAAYAKASARGGQIIYAVDGYQPSNRKEWLWTDYQQMTDSWGNKTLYRTTPTTSWTGARDFAVGIDGDLVRIDDANENAAVVSAAAGNNAWIGAARTAPGSVWFMWRDDSLHDSLYEYSNWLPGRPDDTPSYASSNDYTEVFSNNFDSNSNGSNAGTQRHATWQELGGGWYLGRFGDGGGANVTLGQDQSNGGPLLSAAQSTQIQFDLIRVDSWDDENLVVSLEGINAAGTSTKIDGTAISLNGNSRKGNTTPINVTSGTGAGFKVEFVSTEYANLSGAGHGKSDEKFRVTATLPKGFTKWRIHLRGYTDDSHGNENYLVDNLVVRQSLGEQYASIQPSSGKWEDLSSSSQLPGIAEVVVPNLRDSGGTSLWVSGQPDDGGGTGATRNEENYLALQGWTGKFIDTPNNLGAYLSQASPVWGPGRDLKEAYYNYKYDWTSIVNDLSDRRQNYNYNVVGAVKPIYAWQPLFHQEDITSVDTVSRLAPRLVSQPVYTTQAVTTGVATSYTIDFRLSAAVPFDSIKANRLSITTTGNAATNVSGNLKSTAASTLTTPANSVNLGITSVGALNLGNGSAVANNTTTTTLVANSFRFQGAGLTMANDVVVAGSNGNQPQSLSLDAGSSALSLQSAIAPVGTLTLSGGSLLLPASTTTAFSANSLSLAAGSSLNVSQPGGASQLRLSIGSGSNGAPTSFNLAAGDTAIPTQDFSNPLPAWTTAASFSSAPLVGLTLSNSTPTTALGRFANGSKTTNQDAWTNVDFKNAGGSIEFDLFRLDGWDTENFVVYASDTAILSTSFNSSTTVAAPITGFTNGYSWTLNPIENGALGGSSSFTDQRFRVSIKVPAGIGSLKLGFGSNLNEAVDNESYSIDNFSATNSLGQQLANENFEAAHGGWQQPSNVAASPISFNSTTNNGIGNVLGVFANGTKTTNQDIWRNFNLSGDGGRISLDLHRLESWENEGFNIYANDVVVATANFSSATNITTPITGTTSGYRYTITPIATASNFYGSTGAGSSFNDQTFRITLDVPTGVTTLKLGFGSTLNEAASNEAYAIDNLDFVALGSLSINALSSTLPFVITAGGTVALNAAVSAAALDLTAATLTAPTTTTYTGSGALKLKLTGSSSTDLSSATSPTFVASSFSLDSQAGGMFKVNSSTLNLSSPNALTITQEGSGSTTLSLDTTATFAYTSLGALSVSSLKSGGASINLTATNGDITLGGVTQTPAGSLGLTANAGKVVGSSGTDRAIGALTVAARDGVDLSANQLQSITASTTGAGSDISITAATPGSISLATLSAPDEIRISNSQGALKLTIPDNSTPSTLPVSAAKLSLSAQDAIEIASSSAITLSVANSITLESKNVVANYENLTLKTSQAGGSIWLDFNGLSSADAVKLPLIDSANLTFESSSGVRLRADAFLSSQKDKPLSTITFLRKATSADAIALRHPYLNDSQLLLGSDTRYYGYSWNESTQSRTIVTHFDTSTGKYAYTALTAGNAGVTRSQVTFTSNDYQITAANLSSATFPSGVSSSQVVLSTVYPIFQSAAAGITVSAASVVTTPVADSVSEVVVSASTNNSVATGSISGTIPAGYVVIQENELVRQLVKSGYLVSNGSLTSSPLMNGDVWLDLNRNLRQDDDEPSTITDADGGFTLAVSPEIITRYDSNRDGNLYDEHLRLISTGGIDSLTSKPVDGMVLIGDFSNGVLTPVTTLAALLADAGVTPVTSAAIQKAFGVAVVDVADHSTAYDPYEALAKGDASAFPQVLAHAQLSGLLLLATTLGKQAGLSPVASLQKLAGALAAADLGALQSGSQAIQGSALLATVLPALNPSLTAAQRGVISQVFAQVSAEFDALRAYADQYRDGGLPLRSLLPASNSLKATLTAVFTEFLPQVLAGSISIDQLQQRFAAQLAGGALDTTALRADHLVSVTPLQQGRLQPGGSATFLISLGSTAPAHGLRLIYSLNVPEGTSVDGAPSSSTSSSANGVGEVLIAAGLSATTITIQLPAQLNDAISQVSLNLRYSDSGFEIDPNRASAVYLIDGFQAGDGTKTLQSLLGSLAADAITGSDAPDLITGGWGADSLDGGAGEDQLNGEGGNDRLKGGLGDDQIDGGSGDDDLSGDEGADLLAGGIGDDTLDGGSGIDLLRGDAGNDVLLGDAGDDKLDGGSGNDLLDGGSGRNILFGGSGADRFLLKAPGSESDLILDFNPLEGDQLVVLASRFPDATSQDFAIIGGVVLFRGNAIALVANNGRSYGLIRDLTPYLLFTDRPEAKAQQAPSSPLAGTVNQSVSNTSLALLASPGTGQERIQISNTPVLLANDALASGLRLSKAGGSAADSPSGLILEGPASAPVLVDLSTLNADALADSQITLLLYRVNAAGALLSQDGASTVSSLAAAVIGSIGAVDDDGGRSLFSQGSSQVLLGSGQELRFALSRRDRATLVGSEFQISQSAAGLTLAFSTAGNATPDLLLRASIANQTTAATEMAIAQKAGLGDLLYLNNGEDLDISLASSCGNTNTYAFVKLDLSLDATGSSLFSIADTNGRAVPVANTDAFRAAIRNNLAAGFLVAQGGNLTTSHSWTVSSGSGFYAPVMLSQNGDVFFIGTFNADGQQHIKPIGDGVFCFEDLSAAISDFDYNDGVLRISRRIAASSDTRSLVIGPANAAAATYLSSGVNYSAVDNSQFVHSNGSGGNLITTGSGADTVVLYANRDGVTLGAGQDRVHILSGSSDNNVDLGFDADSDRVYFYRPTAGQALSSLTNFDPTLDTISLVNLDTTSSASFSISATKATLLLDNKPLLELIGSFSSDRLNASIRRSDRGVGDAMAAIAERGLLVTEMIPGLLGTSQQRSDGQWYGYNVDIARAISEQLTGNADALAIRPNQSLLAGLNDVRDGYADLGLLGSTSTLSRDVNLGIDFSNPYLVDMQSFLVLGLNSASELADQTIGVIKGSTAKDNALAFLSANGITATVSEYATSTTLTEALRSGTIAAIASDRTRLMGYQATIGGSTLLEETFSIQPLAVALSENQSRLKDAVNWIVQAPAAATELGISARDLPGLIAQAERGGADLKAIAPQSRVFLELDSSSDVSSSLGKALGLARGFTQKVLARLGNTAEMWQRHFPTASNIEQNTASGGGQLRSLPFLGQGSTDPLIANDDRGDLLALVRQRGSLSVATGGNTANIGFSAPDASGSLQGVDADIARALAIAIFGDPTKVNFVTDLAFSSTFAAVANGVVDVALRASTANLWRDGSFGVDFSDPYLATGLKVLSHSSLGVSRIDQLNGTTIGVIEGTTAAQNLRLALSKTGESARILAYANATELYNAFRTSEVDSIARDGALLAGFQQQLSSEANPIATTLLNGQLSYEPLAAAVDENQSKFLDLVNAVIAILKQAAELGVSSDNVMQKLEEANAANAPAALRQLFQLNANANLSSIGITAQRVTDIILAVGNSDQIVQRWIVNPDQNTLARNVQMQRPI